MKSFRSPNSILRFVPFFIIGFIIPLIKIHISVPHNAEIAEVLIKSQSYDDYFCLIKVCFLYLATALALGVFLSGRAGKCKCHANITHNDDSGVNNFQANDIDYNNSLAGNRLPRVFYLLLPFTFCVLLSVVLSSHRISAVFGIVDQYEGGLTTILYLGVLILSYFLITENSHMIWVIEITLAASVIVVAIGILEFNGIIKIDPPYAVSSTIGNSNYVGTYAVLLFPLSVAMVLLEKDRTKKFFSILIFYGSVLFLLLGSMSRAGYIAALAIIVVGPVLLRKVIREQIGWISGMIVYGLFILILMNFASNGLLFEEIKSLNPFYEEKQEDRIRFEDVKITEKTTAEIKTDHWVLKINYDGDNFSFSNENGEKLLYRHNPDSQAIEFEAEPFRGISGYEYYEDDLAWLMLIIDDRDIEFVYNDGNLQIVGYNGKLTDIREVEAFGFEGKESFASGRGYIWSRTFPLLKKALFIGYGPDTFIYEFPQNDIIGKLNYGAIWTIISKPHSWYLQIAFGSGVLSLLFLLALLIWYAARTLLYIVKYKHAPDSFKIIETNPERESEKIVLSACILLSVIGYCAAGIFNDSTVAVSPVFWMLLGAGIRLTWTNSSSSK